MRWRPPAPARRPQPYRRGHHRLNLRRAAEEVQRARAEDAFSPAERESCAGDDGAWARCLAAKRACLDLFLRETIRGELCARDFEIRQGEQSPGMELEPRIVLSPGARAAADLQWIDELELRLRMHDEEISAVVIGTERTLELPWYAGLLHALIPLRRGVVMENLRRVFGRVLDEPKLRRLARAHTLHFLRFGLEVLRAPWIEAARRPRVRIENLEAALEADALGRGVFLLTGHLGSWEVASVHGLATLPQYRGRISVIRKRLRPAWLDRLVTRRMENAGFRTLPRTDALDTVIERVQDGQAVTFVFDQFARGNSGLRVDFLGQDAATLRSLAILALTTGTPVVPVGSWREPDGSHVLRFEAPLEPIHCEDAAEALWRNTRAYNRALERMLLRHPEQWIWMHRRWKI